MPLLKSDLEHIINHTQDVWEQLRGSRIFITGGTGFFGTWLLESFAYANTQLELNAEMLVLTRNPENFKQKNPQLAQISAIRFITGDVRDFSFPEGNFTHVIHAATEASQKLNDEDPIKMLDVILAGTQHTLDFAVHAKPQKVLLTSSGAIYGRQPSEITHLPEDYLGSPDISKPAWAYGVGKRTAEHMATLYAYQHKLHINIARCFAFVGPHLPLDIHFAMGNFIRDALAGKTIDIKGDGTPFRSYQYAADLCIWLWKILCFGENCRPYNVGSDEDFCLADIAAKVAKSVQPEIAVHIAKQAVPGHTPERYVPSIERAKNELQLKNFIGLEEGIRRTIEWHTPALL
jgi:dTDP-glucose 4,6-dehydratase